MNKKLTFKNHSFNVVEKDNQVWITSKELAHALGYSDSKSVTALYNNNKSEFLDDMSLVVESTTNGINNNLRRIKVRIFSLRGAHLVAIFARTEISKQFRRWVLDILDGETKKTVKTNLSLSEAEREAHAIVLLDKESFAKASKGAKDMNARKRAIKEVKARVTEWESKYQIKLDMPMPSGLLH